MEASDDLSVDVLAALGRVTWNAIVLEDSVGWLCSSIQPVDPRTDHRVITKKIDEAVGALRGWPHSTGRDKARAWLQRARQVLGARNVLLHARPVVWAGPMPDGVSVRQMLGEMPRNGRYNERPMTVVALSEVGDLLAEAEAGWREVMLAVAEARDQHRKPS
jgi:hypothetical protein